MKRKAKKAICLCGADKLVTNLHALRTTMDEGRNINNVEAVHDLRVVSRRLRMGLSVYRHCFQKKTRREWKKELRRMMKSLGQVRDLDVQLLFLKNILKKLPTTKADCEPGISMLLQRLQQERQRQQTKLVMAMDRLNQNKTLAAMEQKFEKMADLHVNRPTKYFTLIYRQARQQIGLRLKKMLAYRKYAHRPQAEKKLHQLRIAAKHLRYTMEYFEPFCNGKLRPTIQQVREIQRLLGEYHDCVVWIEKIPKFSRWEQKNASRYFNDAQAREHLARGLNYLLTNRKKRRKEIYERFRRCWDTAIREDAWGKLRKILKTGANRKLTQN
jgi:CHAD domain-containing protein